MLGVRNQREEDHQRKRVRPPISLRVGYGVRAEVGDHEGEDEGRDRNGLPGQYAQPTRPQNESPEEQACDAGANQESDQRGNRVIDRAEAAFGTKQVKPESGQDMVDGHEGEYAEAPENQGMCESRKRALADDLTLE